MREDEAGVEIPTDVLERLLRKSSLKQRADGYDVVSFRINVREGELHGKGDRRQMIAVPDRSVANAHFEIVEEIAGVPMATFALQFDFNETDPAFAKLERLGIDKALAIAACRHAVSLVRGTIKRGRKVDGFYIGYARCQGAWKLRAV